MKILRILAENLLYAVVLTILSVMLRFYDMPDAGAAMPAFWSQMLRNYIISYVGVTAVRFVSPYIRRIPLKWNRKTAERFEKIFIIGLYAGAFLFYYLIVKSAAGQPG